ncbi:hypothetical protein N7520_000808 [Penicillium odoratum]|uniref:uncharacterized protein n=1 Tax=Penicillium odoratum TaxID=1167516 RepID=UPI002549910C|nr:uncharacterized protein N7520_000808 [Penicillium odoratum]KAJ5777562.1 hypothetical protein N7520_000808 [Penicillium odoratum]
MDSAMSPFSDLDVFADWSGDPLDHVEVKMTVEIHCKPFLDKPILNTRLPKEFVVDYSLRLAEPRAELKETLAQLHSRDYERIKTPFTPESRSANLYPGDSAIHLEYRSNSSEHATVLLDSPNGDFEGVTIVNNVHSPSQENHPLGNLGHSRKRSAKTASLPDSISDSDRPIGGFKHKGSMSVHVSGTSSNESVRVYRPSFIPRPVSRFSNPHHHQASAPGRIAISMASSGSESGSGYLLGEKLAAMKRSANKNRIVDKSKIYGDDDGVMQSNPPAPITNKSSLAVNAFTDFCEGKDGKLHSDTISSEISCGTPCDIHNILDSYGVVDDYPIGPVESMYPVQTPRSPLSSYGSFFSSTPQLLHENGIFRIFCPREVQPAVYKATISFVLPLEKGTSRGWFNFVLPGLPRLQNDCTGYLYFWTPPGQGIEFRTTHLKRHTLGESCMMGQFPIFEKLVIPVRPCDGRFYGFLKDFKVTQTIRADLLVDNDPQTWVIKYHAVCTIDLIQRGFWAEKCGLTLYVYGGPDAEFSAHLHEPRDGFQTIDLDFSPDTDMGISEIQIICTPSNLALFAITWKTRMPRNDPIWMPRIRSCMDTEGTIEDLEFRYMEAENDSSHEVVNVSPAPAPGVFTTRNPPKSKPDDKKRSWSMTQFIILFCIVAVVSRIIYRLYDSGFFDMIFTAGEDDPFAATEPIDDSLIGSMFVNMTDTAPQTPFVNITVPLRDRIDYLLGWRGPY